MNSVLNVDILIAELHAVNNTNMFITTTLTGVWMLLQRVVHSNVQLITYRPVLKFQYWQHSTGLAAFVSLRRFHSVFFCSTRFWQDGLGYDPESLFFQGCGVGFPHPEWLESLNRDLLSCGMTNRTHMFPRSLPETSFKVRCPSTADPPRRAAFRALTHARVTGWVHGAGAAVCGVLYEAQNMLCLCFFRP